MKVGQPGVLGTVHYIWESYSTAKVHFEDADEDAGDDGYWWYLIGGETKEYQLKLAEVRSCAALGWAELNTLVWVTQK